MSDPAVVDLVANDTALELNCTYKGADITDAIAIQLHIDYAPWPLSIDATDISFDGTDTTFTFGWRNKVTSTVDAEALVDDITLEIDAADYASFPASGELLIDGDEAELTEKVRYNSKTSPNILNLDDALTSDHAVGAPVLGQADLRIGKWDAEIEITFADSKNLTFKKLVLNIAKEIA